MQADHKQQQRKQMSNPTSSQTVSDTHGHSKVDAGERSRSSTTMNSMCQKERFNSPALTVWCFWPWNRLINDLIHGCALISILSYHTWCRDGLKLIPHLTQVCCGTSECYVTMAVLELSILKTICRSFNPIRALFYIRNWFHYSPALFMLWSL